MTSRSAAFFRAAALAGLALAAALPASAQELNLYTTREPGLIQPLLDAFTKSTGIKVNSIFVKDGLAERVAAEGTRSPADVLMTVDFGNLIDLVEKGLTQPVQSATLERAVPANLRGAKGEWFALSLRARVLYAAKDLGLTSFNYESLADPKWKGKICIRAGQHPYNTAMIAAHIAHHGEAKTETWLRGIKANLARAATGGDRDVARDIMGGICDIGVGNSYYVGLMRSGAGGPDQVKWGDAIKVILPTFQGGGTQVNVSGASVARHAPNRAAAVRLLEYLVSDEAQKIYAEANFEYPVKQGATIHPIIAELGTLKVDPTPLTTIAQHRTAASRLVDKGGVRSVTGAGCAPGRSFTARCQGSAAACPPGAVAWADDPGAAAGIATSARTLRRRGDYQLARRPGIRRAPAVADSLDEDRRVGSRRGESLRPRSSYAVRTALRTGRLPAPPHPPGRTRGCGVFATLSSRQWPPLISGLCYTLGPAVRMPLSV
jgi:iron(III) transport system substrate-binding protein